MYNTYMYMYSMYYCHANPLHSLVVPTIVMLPTKLNEPVMPSISMSWATTAEGVSPGFSVWSSVATSSSSILRGEGRARSG